LTCACSHPCSRLSPAVDDDVSRLAAVEACPRVPLHVHLVLVQPLEPPRQQCQLVLSKHVEVLIWHRHQRGQREHPGGRLVLVFPFEPPTRARL
jgi:hypothetical protein